MGKKNVSLDASVYERIRCRKRSDETVSEAIDRLTGQPSLRERSGLFSEAETPKDRSSISDRNDGSRERLDRLTERLDS